MHVTSLVKRNEKAIKTPEPREWIVAFYTHGDGFFDRFLWRKSRYRHVALFCKRKLGWYCFSPSPKYWAFEELQVMASSDFSAHIFKMKDCFMWCRVNVTRPSATVAPLLIPTCVQVIKRMMGIDIGFCLSGHGFYKKLVNHDGRGKNYHVLDWRKR